MDYELRYNAAKVLLIAMRKAVEKNYPEESLIEMAKSHYDEFKSATENNHNLYLEGMDVVNELIREDV